VVDERGVEGAILVLEGDIALDELHEQAHLILQGKLLDALSARVSIM
jgi:hypothetical protein